MKLLLLSAVSAAFLVGCDLPESAAIAQARAAVENAKPAETTTDPAATTNAVVVTPPAPPAPDLPPNLPDAAREVVKLAHNQMGDGVVTNFIANLKEPFHLDAEQIVYLRDLGLSPAVLESLLAREQELAHLLPSSPASPAPTSLTVNVTTTNSTPTAYPGGRPELEPPQIGPAVAASTPTDQPPVAPTEINNNFFYNSLAPYGNWIVLPSYGNVWQPSCAVINPGWRPYWNDGCWNWCDSGWFWNSNYSWGWAPFHYGNWVNAPSRGWCWVPGRVWAPSWVTFRSGGGFCGWAPLPPGCGWSSGVGLTWAGSGISVGFGFGFGASSYCWTPTRCFTAPNCSAFGVSGGSVNQIFNNSTVINNYIVGNNNTIINNGIDPAHISSISRSEIRKVQLTDTGSPSSAGSLLGGRGRPGDPTSLAVYRPSVGANAVGTGTGMPSARQEIRPTQLASVTTGDGSPARIPGRSSTFSQPDRLPAPNPRRPAVELHSGSGREGIASSLPGRSGEVRSVTTPAYSSGTISRPGGARSPGNLGNPALSSRGGAPYSTLPGARLEPRKAPGLTDYTARSTAPAAGNTTTRPGFSPQVGGGRPQPGISQPRMNRPVSGYQQAPAYRNNPRPSMGTPAPQSNFRAVPTQRMQAPSVSMSRPSSMPSYNAAPRGGGGGGSSGGGGLQRPGR